MSWIKNDTNPFEDMDIPGLETGNYPNPGYTWYQVRWPSGTVTDIQPDRKDPTNISKLDVHIFGEMDLPYLSTLQEAHRLAFDISESCGYSTLKLDGERLGIQGGFTSPYVITYRDGKMVDVKEVK